MISKKQINFLTFMLLAALLFTGCADVSPHVEDCITSSPYGFWSGLWHGIILPIAWIISLFNDDVAIYAYNNNGGWYDIGFIIGINILGGSSTTLLKNEK